MAKIQNNKTTRRQQILKFWKQAGRISIVLFTAITAIGLIIASYGGDFNPSDIKYISIIILAYPIWLLAFLITTALDIIWHKKALIINVLTLILCFPAIWEFSPLNLFGPDQSKYTSCPKFRLLSYNVYHYESLTGFPDGQNPAVSYIIDNDADIVCMQEAEPIKECTRPYRLISAMQADTIRNQYPYMILCGESQLVLSKYPIEVLPLGKSLKRNPIAAYRITIGETPITVFNIHLQSYNLSAEDKELYTDLTKLQTGKATIKKDIHDVKSQLLAKIQQAAVLRAEDADRLVNYIRHYGGENVIICGDFNDAPGCYTLRELRDIDMHQVYEEVGFGPMITYNQRRMYFRIDHVLYRGNLKPLDISRGSIKASDHYPVTTTFAITSPED